MLTDDEYWMMMRAKICSRCVDGDGSGGCRIAHTQECALKKYFPQILEVVGSSYSGSIEPYEQKLRNKVCGLCIHQSSSGVCSLRNEVDCALDRYFPMIVQVIEEAQWLEAMDRKNREEGHS
jgi:hypothetical protein